MTDSERTSLVRIVTALAQARQQEAALLVDLATVLAGVPVPPIPLPPPPTPSQASIRYFDAYDPTISAGDRSLLHWGTTGAKVVTLDGRPVPPVSSEEGWPVRPTATTEYVLRADAAERRLTVTVLGTVPPVVPPVDLPHSPDDPHEPGTMSEPGLRRFMAHLDSETTLHAKGSLAEALRLSEDPAAESVEVVGEMEHGGDSEAESVRI